MKPEPPVSPTAHDWANASLHVKKVENPDKADDAIYEFRKVMVVNGVQHVQFVWLNQQQLRSVSVDHGL